MRYVDEYFFSAAETITKLWHNKIFIIKPIQEALFANNFRPPHSLYKNFMLLYTHPLLRLE